MSQDRTASDYALRQLEEKDKATTSLTQRNKDLQAQLKEASSPTAFIDALGDNMIAIALILFVIGISISGIVASFQPACPAPTQIERQQP